MERRKKVRLPDVLKERRTDCMLTTIYPRCCPQVATLREYAAFGLKDILAFAEDMKSYTDTLPDDLKPFAELLNRFTIQILTECFAESLRLISEKGFREITGQHSHPHTIIKRRRSNGI
jgi:hypothetical protein